MNGTERRYAEVLEARRLAGEVLWWKFEGIAFRLAEERCFYHPDFMVMMADTTIEIHEVKGGFIRDDGRDKLKIAAALFPFVFRRCVWKDGRWTIAEVGRSAKTERPRRKKSDNETNAHEMTDNGMCFAPSVSAIPARAMEAGGRDAKRLDGEATTARSRRDAPKDPRSPSPETGRKYDGGPIPDGMAVIGDRFVPRDQALAEVQKQFKRPA